MIGSDFKWVKNPATRHCSECDARVLLGEQILASIKDGKAKKYVCSEECRLKFDDYFVSKAIKKLPPVRKKGQQINRVRIQFASAKKVVRGA